MEKFIIFIKELIDDEFSEYLDGLSAQEYFLNGGCFELVKIIRYYFPNIKILINKNYDHVAIKYENEIYDATGKIIGDFQIIDDEDYLNDYFGNKEVKIEHKDVNEAIINELEQCDIEKVLVK